MLETIFFAHSTTHRHACTVTDLDDGPLSVRKSRAIAKATQKTGFPEHELLSSPPIPITSFAMTSVHEQMADGTGWIQRPSIPIPLYGDDKDAARIVRKELTWLWLEPLETGIYTYSQSPTAELNQASNPSTIPLTQGDRS